jgi:uncharacterized protein YjbJ (UPF0337 family)
MNREQFSGKWHEFKGKVKQKWGKITDNEISQINGDYERLVGMIQKHYGYAKEQAEKELKNWCSSCEMKHKQEHETRGEKYREEKGMNRSEYEEKESRGQEFWKKDEGEEKPPRKDQEKKRKAG